MKTAPKPEIPSIRELKQQCKFDPCIVENQCSPKSRTSKSPQKK